MLFFCKLEDQNSIPQNPCMLEREGRKERETEKEEERGDEGRKGEGSDMLSCTYNPSLWEIEPCESLELSGQPVKPI